MKICWLGFGPGMNETSTGLYQFDPEMLSYFIGRGGAFDRGAISQREHTKVFTTPQELFSDLEKFDVIIYDTYVFSVRDRPDIVSFLPGNGCITQWDEWMKLKAKKIMFDGESVSGKDWHRQHIQYFDYIFTTNPAMPGFYTYFGIDHKPYKNDGTNDSIKVLYSGSNLDKRYRKILSDFISKDPKNIILETLTGFEEWRALLNKSKMYLATFSCASGNMYPMHTKSKEYKALLCGALPLTEELAEADKFLIPGKERVTFSDLGDLQKKIDYYDKNESERKQIVEAGKKKVIEELNCYVMWRNAFKAFGIIGDDNEKTS